MKRAAAILTAAVLLSSCGTTTSLYYWGGEQSGATVYENLAYMDYKTQTPESICNLVCLYEKMVTNPEGTRGVPPPGICAEYGYLLLIPQTADIFEQKASNSQKRMFSSTDYASLFRDRGKEMLKMEIELYPESRQFIEPLIKKLAQ